MQLQREKCNSACWRFVFFRRVIVMWSHMTLKTYFFNAWDMSDCRSHEHEAQVNFKLVSYMFLSPNFRPSLFQSPFKLFPIITIIFISANQHPWTTVQFIYSTRNSMTSFSWQNCQPAQDFVSRLLIARGPRFDSLRPIIAVEGLETRLHDQVETIQAILSDVPMQFLQVRASLPKPC